jgi:hypothetical protein
LQRRRHPRPKGFHAFLAASAFSYSLAGYDALGPAEAYFMEIQIGKFRADVMKKRQLWFGGPEH